MKHHGGEILPEIELMAAGCAGTQAGAYLELVVALVRADDDRALAVAEDITAWTLPSDRLRFRPVEVEEMPRD